MMHFSYPSHMNFRHLRAFATIVDAGGFVHAAARLNLSQPALSRQIDALERELHIPLFDRIGRGVKLTSEGEDLLRYARRLLTDVAAFAERASALKGGEAGLLRVGAPPAMIEGVIADFLAQYARRHPSVEVVLVEGGGVNLVNLLEKGDIHLAIVTAGYSRFQEQALYPIRVVAVLPEGHRLSRRPSIELTDLAQQSLLLLSRSYATRELFDAACQVANLRPRVLLESAAPQAIIALTKTGYGVGVVYSTVRFPVGVRAIPIVSRGFSIGSRTVAAWNSQRSFAAYAEIFVKELAAFVKRNYPGHEIVRRAPPLA
jgi:DNA-binding transcriptional LysR family regulator